MKRWGLVVAVMALLAVPAMDALAQQNDDRTRTFNAPPERVWGVARSVLQSLGWKVDKEDPAVGWILTESRRVEGEDYGVYAKGTKHRLRLTIKPAGNNRSTVGVERRVWKEERILWMDKEEDVQVPDRIVERQILDALARSL